jgi:superfamily II DNA/RNA helicase
MIMQQNMLKEVLANLAIEKLNAMQKQVLQTVTQYGNYLLTAPTGTGKTLAYILAALPNVEPSVKQIQVLIIAPSRELVLQIETVCKKAIKHVKINSFYGGHDMQVEFNALLEPPAILIATPGRIADHISKQSFDTSYINTVVIDEFDKSLELGFTGEMQKIIEALPNITTKLLISATQQIAVPKYMNFKDSINIADDGNSDESVLHEYVIKSTHANKADTLIDLLCSIGNLNSIVFCNQVDIMLALSKHLNTKKLQHQVYHGQLTQEERELAIIKYQNGTERIMLATDLAARGLDIHLINHVIHFQIPTTETAYTHRNGRTARMNNTGNAYVLLHGNEYLPSYVADTAKEYVLTEPFILPKTPTWQTLSITAGKKDKINKIDLVGFFLQKALLEKEQLGIIYVKDFISYIAVKPNKVQKVLQLTANEKIKGKKVNITLV